MSAAGGLARGLALHPRPRLRAAVEPVLSAWYAIPTIMFYPVLLVLFGAGAGPIIATAVLLAAVRVRPGAAALIGLVLGLLADSLTPSAFGSGALALALVAYGASTLKAVFFADNAALSALFVFAGKWIFDVVYLVSERRVRGAELVVQLLLWSPLAATATAITALLLLVAFRPAIGRATV